MKKYEILQDEKFKKLIELAKLRIGHTKQFAKL